MRALPLLLLLSASARAAETPAECPKGTHREHTDNPYQPFRCVKEEAKRGFEAVTGTQGFKTRPKCPRGTRPAESSDGLQQYRCVRVSASEADPDLAPITSESAGSEEETGEDAGTAEDPLSSGCPRGKRKVRTNDPLNPFQCVAPPARNRPIGADAYLRYSVPGEMSFEYPRMLQPRDGWKEEVPTLSFTHDDGSPGKPVTITITKIDPSQPTFIDIAGAVAKDKEWQGAKDGGQLSAAGVKARVTFVPGESKTAYIPLSSDAYYAVAYSAPVESYDVFLASFDRLLKTLKLTRRSK